MLYHLFQHLLIIKIYVLSKNDRSRNLEQSIDPTVSRSISLTLHPTFSLMWALLPIHTHVHGTCTWASCFVSLRYIVFLFRIKIYVLLICLECFYKYICLFIVAWYIFVIHKSGINISYQLFSKFKLSFTSGVCLARPVLINLKTF